MSAKSLYVSERVYRELSPITRRHVCRVLGGKENVVKRYVCNILSDLNARGEHELARELEENLTDLNYSAL